MGVSIGEASILCTCENFRFILVYMNKKFNSNTDIDYQLTHDDYWKLYSYIYSFKEQKWGRNIIPDAFVKILEEMEGHWVVSMDTDRWAQIEKPNEAAKEIIHLP